MPIQMQETRARAREANVIECVGRNSDNTLTNPFSASPFDIQDIVRADMLVSPTVRTIFQIEGRTTTFSSCNTQYVDPLRVVASWHKCRECHQFVPRADFLLAVSLCKRCLQIIAPCISCGHDVRVDLSRLYTPDIYGYVICNPCSDRGSAGTCRCGNYTIYRSRGRPPRLPSGAPMYVCSYCSMSDPRSFHYDEQRNSCIEQAETDEQEYEDDIWEDDSNEDDENFDGTTDYIYEYGYKPTPTFFPAPSKDELFLGVELEADGFRDRTGAGEELAYLPNKNYFYMKADGSLSNGIEVVTHPATLKFHLEEFQWGIILDKIKELGAQSHYTRTCGLHIHFNKNYFGSSLEETDANELLLLYIFEKFWVKLLRFSRRSPQGVQTWASKFNTKLTQYKQMNLAQYARMKDTSSRHKVVNIIGQDTIEIRLFRGTLSIDTLFATIELVAFLATLVKNHSSSTIYRLTWKKLVEMIPTHKYPHLHPYLVKKKLKESDVSCVLL